VAEYQILDLPVECSVWGLWSSPLARTVLC